MCHHCDLDAFIEQATRLLSDLDDISDAGADFVDSVRRKVGGMKEWAEDNGHVTDAMEIALTNMREGVDRWLQ